MGPGEQGRCQVEEESKRVGRLEQNWDRRGREAKRIGTGEQASPVQGRAGNSSGRGMRQKRVEAGSGGAGVEIAEGGKQDVLPVG